MTGPSSADAGGFEASVRAAPPDLRGITTAVRNLEVALRRMRRRYSEEFGLSANEYTAVMTVSQRGHVTPSELAQVLTITAGAVTTLLDRLTRLDLVERRPNPDDRRSINVELSENALRLRHRVYSDYFNTVSKATLDNPDLLDPRLHAALATLAAAITASNSPETD